MQQTRRSAGHHEGQLVARLAADLRRWAQAPLKDAAAINSTRWTLYQRLKSLGLPVETGSGGLTTFNRTQRGLDKGHWQDAACVGLSTPLKLTVEGVRPLLITSRGHGTR